MPPSYLKAVVLLALAAPLWLGCIWDAVTLEEEKARRPGLAEVILKNDPGTNNRAQFLQKAAVLKAAPRTNDVAWLNELAGALIRAGDAQAAIETLEPVISDFPHDYGIHANLGTAYHLTGRYADAEREIRRGLEINPDAHFGLERYHLALLQYLVRSPAYQRRHVYIDEFSAAFLTSEPQFLHIHQARIALMTNVWSASSPEPPTETNKPPVTRVAVEKALFAQSDLDLPPPYRRDWNLADDTNFIAGVAYMAQLNPRQPAAFVMAGVAAFSTRDFNLGIAAFQRAIDLGSPQADLLQWRIEDARKYIEESQARGGGIHIGRALLLVFSVPVGLAVAAAGVFAFWRRRRSNPTAR